MLGTLYAQVALARRRIYRREGRQRWLQRPVVSVGNLRVGGTGKTPTVAHVARLLLDMGERPSILSRGYARPTVIDGVVVVSDGRRVRADLAASGDEPLMLARSVPGARVLVSADRYLAGRLAETHLAATVHLLDDGFQHLPLARGTDLVIVGLEDVADPRTLPMGRLREPLGSAAAAAALLVPDASDDQAAALAERLNVATAFRLMREAGAPMRLDLFGPSARVASRGPVYALAGVARPARFFEELQASGWTIVGTAPFPDHRRYTTGDLAALVAAARSAGATALITTEKDVMRLLSFRPLPLPLIWVPLDVRIEPAPAFRRWLSDRLVNERSAGRGAQA
jgi:tetraacyldisaccharide 4'-kinase